MTSSSTQTGGSPYANFLAGGFGGMGSVLAGHPLDTVKVRLQTPSQSVTKPSLLYKGTIDCAVKIVKYEGFVGLYQGILFPFLVVTPRAAMSFYGFRVGKDLLTPHGTRQEDLPAYKLFSAGMLAGVFATFLMVPAERVKCLLQVQAVSQKGGPRYSGSVDCARHLYREMGMCRGLFRGTAVTLLRDIPYCGTFFMTYTLLKKGLAPENNRFGAALGMSYVLIAGGLAGMASWTVAFVPDTIKSRIQSAPIGAPHQSIYNVFTEIVRTDGPRSLYRGLTPAVIRAFPANAVFFGCYELAMKVLLWMGC